MSFENQIAPFSYMVDDDGQASVNLYTSEKYKQKLFKTRKGFSGSGYDWESLAQVFIRERTPTLEEWIDFDSERLAFVAYSSNPNALKQFVVSFKEACENEELITDIFSRTTAEEPITAADMKSVMDKIMGRK
jgi:hypothetical protein